MLAGHGRVGRVFRFFAAEAQRAQRDFTTEDTEHTEGRAKGSPFFECLPGTGAWGGFFFFSPQRHRGHRGILPPRTPSTPRGERRARPFLNACRAWARGAGFLFFAAEAQRAQRDFTTEDTEHTEGRAKGSPFFECLPGMGAWGGFFFFSPQRHRGHRGILPPRTPSTPRGERRARPFLNACRARARGAGFSFFRRRGTEAQRDFTTEDTEHTEGRAKGSPFFECLPGTGAWGGFFVFSPQRHRGHRGILPPRTPSTPRGERRARPFLNACRAWARGAGVSFFRRRGTEGTEGFYHRGHRAHRGASEGLALF